MHEDEIDHLFFLDNKEKIDCLSEIFRKGG